MSSSIHSVLSKFLQPAEGNEINCHAMTYNTQCFLKIPEGILKGFKTFHATTDNRLHRNLKEYKKNRLHRNLKEYQKSSLNISFNHIHGVTC